MHEDCIIEEFCSKCRGYKTWNCWYHLDNSLCDDCYYIEGIYYNLSYEEASIIEFNKNNNPTYIGFIKEELNSWNEILITQKDKDTISLIKKEIIKLEKELARFNTL